jgi:hypothetical protein
MEEETGAREEETAAAGSSRETGIRASRAVKAVSREIEIKTRRAGRVFNRVANPARANRARRAAADVAGTGEGIGTGARVVSQGSPDSRDNLAEGKVVNRAVRDNKDSRGDRDRSEFGF